MRLLHFFLLLWASIYKVEAQTFIWESNPQTCDIPYVKIKETLVGEFFIIGNNNCSVNCFKLNKYGNLVWETFPKTFSIGLTDFISYDEDKTFYVIGFGNPDLSSSLLFKTSINGIINFESQISFLRYFPLSFNNKLYKNKIVTCGYNFYPYPKISPIIEYRGLNGDTLGKTEMMGGQYRRAQRIFSLKDKPGFLVFCGDKAWTLLTIIQTDSFGNEEIAKTYGSGENGYQTDFHDLMEKNYSYYLLAGLNFNKSSSGFERGTYIYKFNEKGDSMGLKFIELNPTLKAIAPTQDNGFIIAGDVLIKLDSNYQEEWREVFKKNVRITSVGQSFDGGYYGSGSYFDETINRNKTFIFKTDSKGKIDQSQYNPKFLVYPNPFSDKINFELPFGKKHYMVLYDLQGKKCRESEAIGSTYLILENLPKGIYLLHLLDENKNPIQVKKMLKME
jgi:hypothetical protein